MKKSLTIFVLVLFCIANVLPEKIQNIQDLQKLAEEGDSNAQCLLGLQEMIGGDLYDPRIIDTVTVEQILLNKVEKWQDQIRFLPSDEKGSEFETGSKTQEALKWVQKSAEQGNRIALYCLGRFYQEGLGVEKNLGEALKNYKKSNDRGFIKSYLALGGVYWEINDNKKWFDLIWQGYDKGDLDCKVSVGTMFLFGDGVTQNKVKGFKHIEEAYLNNNRRSIAWLGQCYLNGWGTTKDPAKAFFLFKEGANVSRLAKYWLGRMYLEGTGTEKDEGKGVLMIKEVAATGGAYYAKSYLGYMYANGLGVKVDFKKAIYLYEEAAKGGDRDAMFDLGNAYYSGLGVKEDKSLGEYWLKKAKDRGSEPAIQLMKKIEAQKIN